MQASRLLTGGLEQVPTARRLVRDVRDQVPSGVADDAELVVSELVTNAFLHGRPPVTVGLTITPHGTLRVAVEDVGRGLPVLPRDSNEAMTGRGLRLVASLSQSWGVDPSSEGKVVWAELSLEGSQVHGRALPDMDIEALLAAFDDDEDEGLRRYTVRLGSVPTRLLLAAKEHVDNLVRELTFAGTRFDGEELPAHITELTSSVVAGFAEARSSIKRQAIAAANAGEIETQLVLSLPATAVEAGEAYLAGLDEADRYARAARLLTLETPPTHRVFRRWYVQSLVDQLRAHAAGIEVPEVQTFPERLAEELTALSRLSSVGERIGSLYEVSAALSGVLTPEEVARVVVHEGTRVLGAYAGEIALGEGDTLVPTTSSGYTEKAAEPALLVHRSGSPLWIDSPETLHTLYPELSEHLARAEPRTVATCGVPLVAGHQLGVLRFSFDDVRLFDEEERRFVLALADQAAVALERSGLYDAERSARRDAEALAARLDLLTRVTGELTGARDVEEVVRIVTTRATEQLGAHTARIYLLHDDVLRAVGQVGGDASLAGSYEEFPVAAELPGGVALRTDGPVVLHGATELAARFPLIAGVYADDRSLFVAPLTIREHRLGVLSLSFQDPDILASAAQLSFLTTLADTTAQALERTLAGAEAAVAGGKLAFLAEASGVLSSRLDVRAALGEVARLIVPRLADWCVVHLVGEDEAVEAVEMVHSDPERVAWARTAAALYPAANGSSSGVMRVIRTGVSELHRTIPEAVLTEAARDDAHLALLRDLHVSSAIITPLAGRSGTYGALTLLYTDSRRRYDAGDLELAEDLARRIGLAVETATAFTEQQLRLAAVIRVAEAAQRAILADPPAQLGPVRLSARYVSANAEARIGGDLYEVVRREGAVRLLIGDVRGKGLDAVRKATIVLGEFRSAAADDDDLVEVAAQLDRRLRSHLDAEDFVTALVVEIADDGLCTVASCGHPPAMVVSGGQIRTLDVEASLPLGLGAVPVLQTTRLVPGDRVLLYTDGLVEARAQDRSFVDLEQVTGALVGGSVHSALDRLLERLRAVTGQSLGDDLALLLAEYSG